MENASAFHVFLAVVMGVALIGFITGTQAPEASPESPTAERGIEHPGVSPAKSYAELREGPRGTGSGWASDIEMLRADGPGVTDAVEFANTSLTADLSGRASLRAYAGAPPRIPHTVRQDSASECLACHDQGLQFRGLTAPKMSHTSYSSCTQCHVVTEAPMPGGDDLPNDPRAVASSFRGMSEPTGGPRASAVAPPQVPHRTFMRENCDSCHGLNGSAAMRSSHPWRTSCQQCHAAPAILDQRTGAQP
jgi:cytochrome c-type protein NapB